MTTIILNAMAVALNVYFWRTSDRSAYFVFLAGFHTGMALLLLAAMAIQ